MIRKSEINGNETEEDLVSRMRTRMKIASTVNIGDRESEEVDVN